MSHTFIPTTTSDGGDPYEGRGAERLRGALESVSFPARQDDLLAALVHQHAPPPMLQRLLCLPRETLFESAEQVCRYVREHRGSATRRRYQPREPH